MSASDAAPLPRLGEVFFDVRGNSRSMRLSWYADTDVAVFSIWQGGKCTGTFRLPMDDLGRMIEILRRGPERRSGLAAGERRPGERGPAERGTGERRSVDPVGYEPGYSGGYDADNTVIHNPGGRTSGGSADDYGADQRGAGQYGTGDFSSRGFSAAGPGEYGSDGYGAADYGPDYRSAEHRSADHYGPGDYAGDHAPAEYAAYGRPRTAHRQTERYEQADYGRPDYDQGAEWWQDEDHYQPDRTGQRHVPAGDAGYGEQRFVPPYVGSGPDSSERGFVDDPDYRLPADPAGRSRHSAGRHSGGQGH